MASEQLMTGLPPNTEIFIDLIGGDCIIEVGADGEIRARGDSPHLSGKNDGSVVKVSCSGDCRLYVPSDSRITLEMVGGDAKITGIEGLLNISTAAADLVLRQIGEAHIKQVGGDLDVKHAASVDTIMVGGDARFREIKGDVNVKTIAGDALLGHVDGSSSIELVGGDLVLDTPFGSEHTYQFSVGGDVIAKISDSPDVRFVVPSITRTEVQTSGAQVSDDGTQKVITLGNGTTTVAFNLIGGELQLAGWQDKKRGAFEVNIDAGIPENFEELIEEQVEEQIEAIREQLNRGAEHLRRNAERIAEQARHQAKHAAKHASKQRKWEFKFDWPKRRTGEFSTFGFGFGAPEPPIPPNPPTPPTPPTPAEPVRENERLAILKMVEEKRITIEEAEKLLSALEGTD